MRWLIAEDNEVDQRIWMRLLAGRDVEVTIVDDADALVEAASSEPTPDLVVVDSMLRVGSGVDAVREIRAGGGPSVRIVMVSGREPHELLPLVEGLDVEAVLRKPDDLAGMRELIDRLAGPRPSAG